MKTKYKLNDAIEVNDLDNELVIIIPQTEKMYYCNKLARDIFYYIQNRLTVQQIMASLLVKYDVDEKTLKSDVDDTLNKLVNFQIIAIEE